MICICLMKDEITNTIDWIIYFAITYLSFTFSVKTTNTMDDFPIPTIKYVNSV